MEQLETALRSDRQIVHFLYREGFIHQNLRDDVMNPRSMLDEHEKAGVLVTRIMDRVKLSAHNYHTLLEHLRQRGKSYESIVKILNREYNRQQQTGEQHWKM